MLLYFAVAFVVLYLAAEPIRRAKTGGEVAATLGITAGLLTLVASQVFR